MTSAADRPTVGRALPRTRAWGVVVCLSLVAGVTLLPAFPASATGFVVTSPDDAGPGSLRQAILDANATPGPDVITFSIGSGGGAIAQTIVPTSPLPAITEQVTIDGLSQPAASCTNWPPTLLIRIDGSNAGAGAAGLTVANGAGTVIRGLVIRRFGGDGVSLDAPATATTVTCDAIGTTALGAAGFGNGGAGVAVRSTGAASASTSITNDVIVSNAGPGVLVDPDARLVSIRGNRIDGNGGVGIDLVAAGGAPDGDGATPNGATALGLGGNDLQLTPDLSSATNGNGATTVKGSLTVPAAQTAAGSFVIEFFASPSCDSTPFPGGAGEGARPLGSISLPEAQLSSPGVVPFTATGLGPSTTGNAITATATGGRGAGNTSEFSSCVSVTDPSTPIADLSVVGSVTPDPAPGDTTLTYSLVVHDAGPDPAAFVTLANDLPPEVTFASVSSSAGACTMPVPTIVCDLGAVSPGQANDVTVTITVTAEDVDGSLQLNDQAAVGSSTTDPKTSNNSAAILSSLQPRNVDLSVTKHGPATVTSGDDFSYTIGVSNAGPDPAHGVTVTDALPAGVSFVGASLSAGTCTEASGVVTCLMGTLADGTGASIDLRVHAEQLTGANPVTVSNTASVSSDRTDLNPDDDTSPAVRTTIVPGVVDPDLQLKSVVNVPNPVTGGYDLGSTATVTNLGPGDATKVALTDTLAPGETFVVGGSDPRCAVNGGVVTCPLGALAKGATVSVLIVTRTPKVSQETKIQEAFAVSAPEDSTPANDGATVTTTVEPPRVDFAAAYVPASSHDTWITDATFWARDDPAATMTDPTVAAVGVPGGGHGGPVTITENPCGAPFVCMTRRSSDGRPYPAPSGVFGNLVTITVPQGYGAANPVTGVFLDNWSVAGWGDGLLKVSYLDGATGAFAPQLPWCRGWKPASPPCVAGIGRVHNWWNPYANWDVWSAVRFTGNSTFGRGR